MFDDLAHRADRAMRTTTARRTASEAHELMRVAGEGEAAPLAALERRRGWRRESEREFVCAFGRRKSSMHVPVPFDAVQLIRLVMRVEVNVCLGDTDPVVLADLQALAQRELHQLLEAG